ncbi:unnamed protein product [Cuscuta europaea]|uniref:Uncharacterized protein n=1 Tax=Cuscuta europaea TaxID=41803 RepID=A0A9P0ZI65_CUSEU|nr:unnamed protein product [Cuscuta europaea]
MSRCFPFPPPGYEKKLRPEDVGILKEDKEKVKRHNKDKKDKKRERKEKKEKDKSDRKHKGKNRKDKHKDKREKHRGKKDKDKDQGIDKERSSISEEARLADNPSGIYSKADESKSVQELGRRIKDDEKGKKGNRFGEVNRDEQMDRFVGIQNFGFLGVDNNGKSMVANMCEANTNKFEGMPRPLGVVNTERKEEEEQPKGGNERMGHIKERGKSRGFDGKPWHSENHNRRTKKSPEDKDRKREEKEKVKGNNKVNNTEQDVFRAIATTDSIVVTNGEIPHVFRVKNNDAAPEGEIISKRKTVERNGLLHKDETRPAKIPRPATTHEMPVNVSKVDTLQTPNIITTAGHGGGGSELKVGNTVHIINGKKSVSPTITTAYQISIRCPDEIAKPSKKPHRPKHIDETSKKSPHPDLKFLSQILSVPKMEEWNECDGQEWLFVCKDESSSATKCMDIPSADIEQQVWSEARHCISADIVALPYVIPY